MRVAAISLAVFAMLAAAASPTALGAADPADQPPFGGEPVPPLVDPGGLEAQPEGFSLSVHDALDRANATEQARAFFGGGGESGEVDVSIATRGSDRWEVRYRLDGEVRALVIVDDALRRGRRGMDRQPGRDQAHPRLRGRGLGRPQRVVAVASALPALLRAVLRPQAPVPAAAPRPAGAARLQRLALLLQQGRDRGLGAAGLPGARLPAGAHADRGVQAGRAAASRPRAAASLGAAELAARGRGAARLLPRLLRGRPGEGDRRRGRRGRRRRPAARRGGRIQRGLLERAPRERGRAR